MKKKNRFSVPSKYIFAALALLCVGMMFASYSTGFAGSTLGRISGYVFVPFERGINTVGGWLRSRADSLEDLADAQAKNEELQSQVDELTLENSRLMQNQYRLEELEELYALDQTYSEYNKVAANIIASDSGNWFNTFVIDKGSSDGIQVDMNVIAGSGLVGIVTRVGDNWAQVRAIIDDMSQCGALPGSFHLGSLLCKRRSAADGERTDSDLPAARPRGRSIHRGYGSDFPCE